MEDGEKRIALCSLYLLFGIAMIAMSFNLVQEEVISIITAINMIIITVINMMMMIIVTTPTSGTSCPISTLTPWQSKTGKLFSIPAKMIRETC